MSYLTSSSDGRTPGRLPLWMPFVDAMVERAVRGLYIPGQTIPTEAALGAEFGVSRSVVREAIKVLEGKGILRIDRGRGTVVQPTERWRTFDPLILEAQLRHGDRAAVLHEVLVLRMGIEPELAAGAALNARDQQRQTLTRIAADLTRSRNQVEEYLDVDAAFHDAIADASGIRLGCEIIRTIARPVAVQRALTAQIPHAPARSHDQHLAIFDAIVQGDPDRARKAMREHLEWAEQRLDAAVQQSTRSAEQLGDHLIPQGG